MCEQNLSVMVLHTQGNCERQREMPQRERDKNREIERGR